MGGRILHKSKGKMTEILKFIRFALSILFLAGLAHAQSAPKYIMTVSREVNYLAGASPAYSVYSSFSESNDTGVFSSSISNSGTGLPTGFDWGSTTYDLVTLYVKSTAATPYRLSKVFTGSVSAGSSTVGYCGLAQFGGFNLSFVPSTGIDMNGPTTWAYQNSRYSAVSQSNPIRSHNYSTGNATITQTFPAYPGVTYRAVNVGWISALERRRAYLAGVSGSYPHASYDVNYQLTVAAGADPLRKREPGNTPGPKEYYTWMKLQMLWVLLAMSTIRIEESKL